MDSWYETVRNNSREVTASMRPHSYKACLQVFTAQTQRTRQDGASFISGCKEVQIMLCEVVPDEPSLSYMAIAKWEHNQLVAFQEMAGRLVTGS